MGDPIVIKYRATIDELLSAQQLHLRYSRFGLYFRFLKILGVVAILAGLAIILRRGTQGGGVFLILSGIAFLLVPWFGRYVSIKFFAKRPDRDLELEWQISPAQLVLKSAVSKLETEWSLIYRVRRTPEGFLLYWNAQMFHWLLMHGFQEPADVERLAQIAQSRVKQYDQVT